MGDPLRDIPNPDTANEIYFDTVIDRAVDVAQFTNGEKRESDRYWQGEDLALALWLRTQIPRLTRTNTKRNREFLKLLRERRAASHRTFSNRTRTGLSSFAKEEARSEQAIIQKSIPIKTKVKPARKTDIRANLKKPIRGLTVTQRMAQARSNDILRIAGTVMAGVGDGADLDTIMREVAGTRAASFADGALAVNRRGMAGFLQTAITHAVNAAKEAVWGANGPKVRALRWTAMLDNRTTAICRSRDGKFTPLPGGRLLRGEPRLVPPEARPPAHFACRSWMTAVLDGEAIVGDRVVVTMQDGSRVDFRKLASQNGTSIATERRKFIDTEFGGPAKMLTYNDWLKRQPSARQDEILGQTKGQLFREGGLTVDSFVDRAGNELTLKQLSERRPSAFRKAGLDPETF